MEGVKQYKSLEEIDPKNERNFVGYYWMSDSQNPITVNGANYKISSINPFIIEGMLWDATNKISVMIKHSGRYIINEFDLNEVSSNKRVKIEKKEYLPFRLKDAGAKEKVFFNQVWFPEKDPLCEDMEVLKLKAIIFTGF